MSSESSRKEEEEEASVSLDVLPDDLLEKTLSLLPISSIRNANLVSKRWHAVVQRPWAVVPPPQAAIFLMFVHPFFGPAESQAESQYYNPSLRRWSTARLPSIEMTPWDIVASNGLVCVISGPKTRRRLFVCNPVTGDLKQLPHGSLRSNAFSSDVSMYICKLTNRNTVAMSVDRQTKSYTVAVVSCCRSSTDNWDVSVHVYESSTQTWVVALTEAMSCSVFRSVICGGVLYCSFISDSMESNYCLLMYDLAARPRPKAFVPVPPLILKPSFELPIVLKQSNLWLMNLREKVVAAAFIPSKDRPFSMVGLGIWVLRKEGWCEVARMAEPRIKRRFFETYGLIYCSGAGDFVYVHHCHSRSVLIFDMVRKEWAWSECPMHETGMMCPGLIVTGFCFEPSLKINC